MRMTNKVKRVVKELFEAYLGEPKLLPPGIFKVQEGAERAAIARAIADFIAGMTDNFALAEHKRLFDPGVRA
jgi:dGTPase